MFGIEIGISEITAGVTAVGGAVGWIAKFKTNNIIKEGQEGIEAIRALIKELSETRDKVTQARADGTITPDELDEIVQEVLEDVKAGEYAYVQVSEALNAAGSIMPSSVKKKLDSLLVKTG